MTGVLLASRGDALTPYLLAALQRRFPGSRELPVDLTPVQRSVVAAGTFRPSRTAWVEQFYKSSLAFRLRSVNAARRRSRAGGHDHVLQVHALFDVPDTNASMYIDCTHRQSAEYWPAWNPLTGSALQRWYDREERGYHRAAHLFAFSEATRHSLVEDYHVPPDRVTTTGAGVNLAALPALTGRAAAPTILFIGNDFVRKGGLVLLDAFRTVRRAVPGVRLQLVGTDPRLPAQDGVEVLGRIHDRAVIEQLYRQASVFALPSYFDPFPLVLLEAMAFGLPTVSSRSCGIPEMVGDGAAATTVEAGDVAALATALIATLSDPDAAAAQGRVGRARVEEHFTWDAVVNRMAPAILRSTTRVSA